jgi:hypothetical protein
LLAAGVPGDYVKASSHDREHRPFKELTAKLSPERKARVAARVADLKTEMALAELRQARERSQEELARTLSLNQPAGGQA